MYIFQYRTTELYSVTANIRFHIRFCPIISVCVLLTSQACESQGVFSGSHLLWPVVSLLQSTAHYPLCCSLCMYSKWVCMCMYCTFVCVYVHAVWTIQLHLPPQTSCWWLLTLAGYHSLVTQRSMENAAFPQHNVYVVCPLVSEWEWEWEREKKKAFLQWESYCIVWSNCAIYI